RPASGRVASPSATGSGRRGEDVVDLAHGGPHALLHAHVEDLLQRLRRVVGRHDGHGRAAAGPLAERQLHAGAGQLVVRPPSSWANPSTTTKRRGASTSRTSQ